MKPSCWLFLFVLMVVLWSCGRSTSVHREQDSLSLTADSLQFQGDHPYAVNDNFVVVVDTLSLESDSLERNALSGLLDSSNVVRKGDLLVIADYTVNPRDSVDSVWVKVARDQYTIGWVREGDLLKSVVPDDPISQFIHYFSSFNRVFFLLLSAIAVLAYLYRKSKRKLIRLVHLHDIDSPYPSLLCVVVSGAAVFYGSIQHFAPETWVHFYYYPTLNPFILPLGMACFITCVWTVILLLVAVMDEVFRKLPLLDAVYYLVGLSCWCMLCYIFFSLSTPYYIGYLCYLLYVLFVVRHHLRISRYRCGACGADLPSANCVCPKCGAKNEC